MKTKFWAVLAIALMAVACSGVDENKGMRKDTTQTPAERQAEIAEMEHALHPGDDISLPANRAKADALVKRYRDYVEVNPKDSMSAEYLLKAADLSIGMGNYEASIRYLDRLTTDFQSFDRIVEAYLLRGFVYEAHMNQYAEAVKAYEALIERFPNHRLAETARAAIDNMQLSDEELIEKFKAMNADQPAS